MRKCIVVADIGQGKTKISAYQKEENKYVLFSGTVFVPLQAAFPSRSFCR